MNVRSRPAILRIAAFLMILVFLQKAGAGLFIHEIFHTDKKTESSIPSGEKNQQGYSCTCIDDFLMPFIETDEPVCSFIPLATASPVTYFNEAIPYIAPLYSSLRAPPASMV